MTYKKAGDLIPGDVYTERPYQGPARSYRVVAIRPSFARTVVEVTSESITTGKRTVRNLFRANRVEIRKDRGLS
jgi:hypothetical protein